MLAALEHYPARLPPYFTLTVSPRQVELALKKQRLQFKSAALRTELSNHATALMPVFAVGDKLRAGAFWLRRHPEVAVAAGAVLMVARPRALFRWTRRGVVAWQSWRRVGAWLEARRSV